MGNNENLKDDFLKGMFKKSSLESPSDDFTATVMNRIQTEVVQRAEDSKPIIETKYWIIIISGILVAAYVLFQMDWSFLETLFASVNIDAVELPKVSFSFLDGIKDLLSGIQIPSILLIVIAAIASLFTIDRILKQRMNLNLLFF